jgi:hypothetical protein
MASPREIRGGSSVGNTQKAQLLEKVLELCHLHEVLDFKSYDYYDWWSTPWGGRLKQWAYRTEPVGTAVFGGPVMAAEMWLPVLRRALRINRRCYPIAIAQHGLACLELHKYTAGSGWLEAALDDVKRLMAIAIPGAGGLCWGFPFTWSTNVGIIPANLPAATQTAYAFDLFDQLYQVTGNPTHLDSLLSIADAMELEYTVHRRGRGVASTYHGRGFGDIVMNAITYRIHILARVMTYGRYTVEPLVMALVNFVLDQQNSDGSWFYGENAKNRFIDHYHTCFVIKNLVRANLLLRNGELESAIIRATHYYWSNLFDQHGMPRPYARSVRFNLVKYEALDWAECLGLFCTIREKYGFTSERLESIRDAFIRIFWSPTAGVKPRIYRLPASGRYPYFRWGVSATLLTFARLLSVELAP